MLDKFESIQAPTELVCPRCGIVHRPDEYASLDTECQALLAMVDLSDKASFVKQNPAE